MPDRRSCVELDFRVVLPKLNANAYTEAQPLQLWHAAPQSLGLQPIVSGPDHRAGSKPSRQSHKGNSARLKIAQKSHLASLGTLVYESLEHWRSGFSFWGFVWELLLVMAEGGCLLDRVVPGIPPP